MRSWLKAVTLALALLVCGTLPAQAKHRRGRHHERGRHMGLTRHYNNANPTPGVPRRVRRGRNPTPGVPRGREHEENVREVPNGEVRRGPDHVRFLGPPVKAMPPGHARGHGRRP